MEYRIGRTDDRLFDARIDVEGSSVTLHSRGGATGGRPPRNAGYSEALETICRRAVRNGRLHQVLIDSARARTLPESERVLIAEAEIATLDAPRLARSIRARMRRFGQAEGVTGGNATKQVRFDFSLPHHSVITSLRLRKARLEAGTGASESPFVERLEASSLRQVTTLQIRRAVDRLVAGEDVSHFGESTDYDLVAQGGIRLAPKKVFALALEEALSISPRPGHFSAGWSQPCFQLLVEAGFQIVPKSAEAAPSKSPHPADTDIPGDPEERSWAEGSPRFRSHARIERRRDPAAAAAKRLDVRRNNGGRLRCENEHCRIDWYDVFPVPIAESVFEVHHSIPVASMGDDHQTSIADLKCLCASCHRAEHRRLTLLDMPSA